MKPGEFDPTLLSVLVCPRSKEPLTLKGNKLTSACGNEYPIVDGIPILLLSDVPTTGSGGAELTFKQVQGKEPLLDYSLRTPDPQGSLTVDPLVQEFVAAAGGNLYKRVRDRLVDYPIPEFPLEGREKQLLIDLGCHWGRWSLAAARKGFFVVGVDPSLEAVRAARRIAKQLDISAHFVVGDGRYLPFKDTVADVVFSFSVLQHFSRPDVKRALESIQRILKPNGLSLVQMPNCWSVLGLYHLIRRGFRDGRGFEVRYWSPSELKTVFDASIGKTDLYVDSFLSLNAQVSDLRLLPWFERVVVRASGLMVDLSNSIPRLQSLADSLYVKSQKT